MTKNNTELERESGEKEEQSVRRGRREVKRVSEVQSAGRRGKKAAKRREQKIALVRLKYDERFDRVSDGRAKLHIKLIPTAATTR